MPLIEKPGTAAQGAANRADLLDLQQRLERLGPVASFPWHTQQMFALRAATDKILVVGGNRSGKSTVGEGIVSWLARRDGPVYRRLLNPEGRKLRIWVAPQTDEKAKSLWEPRLLKSLAGLGVKYTQAPHRVFRWDDALGGGELWLKSQEQGFLAFESDDVDCVLFDEEPLDPRVARSAETRLATTNGVLIFTYTPLNGMTWTYDEMYSLVAEHPEFEIADRVWRDGNGLTVIQMGMADNPLAVKGGGVNRIKRDPSMSEAEKNARLYGKYGYTEGLLVPQFATISADSDSPYVIDALPKGRSYHWILTADPNKRHGALLTAIDHEGNRYYCAEHYAESLPDSEHARAYRAMLAQFRLRVEDVDVYADPGGAGSQAIINLAEVGFFAAPVPKDPGSVSASIKRLRRAAHMSGTRKHPITGKTPSPQVFFLRSLESTWKSGGRTYQESRLMWELRQYRQKERSAPDTPVKVNDDLVDCARYVELAHAESPEAPILDHVARQRKKLDELSLREAKDFDKVLAKVERLNPAYLVTP